MRPLTRHLLAISLLLLALPAAVLITLPAAATPARPGLIATPTPLYTPDPSITPAPPDWPPVLRYPPPFGRTWLPYAAIDFAAGPASLADPARGRLYLAGDDTLAVYSTGPVPTRLAEFPLPAGRLFLGPGGDRLYATTPAPNGGHATIHVIDAGTLAITAALPYACPAGVDPCRILDLAEGPDRRLYVAPVAPQTRVDVLDGLTGDTLAAVIATSAPQPAAQLEIHGSHLYVAPADIDNHGTPDIGLAAYDISAAAPAFLAGYEAPVPLNGMRLSADGSLLFISSGYGFHVLDTEVFFTFRMGQYGVLRDLMPDRTVLLSTYDAAGRSAVYAYDPGLDGGNRGLNRRSPLAGDLTPYALALPGGGIATLHDAAVILRRPIDRAAALPIVTSSDTR